MAPDGTVGEKTELVVPVIFEGPEVQHPVGYHSRTAVERCCKMEMKTCMSKGNVWKSSRKVAS